jgi:hypothetical protein
LVMVKSWNIALEKCCDKVGLTGSHRASIIEQTVPHRTHRAGMQAAPMSKPRSRSSANVPNAK